MENQQEIGSSSKSLLRSNKLFFFDTNYSEEAAHYRIINRIILYIGLFINLILLYSLT